MPLRLLTSRLHRLPLAALALALMLALAPRAAAQDDPFPVDCSMFDAETTYSLYYEFYKNEEYDLAKPYLRCQLQNFPLAPNNDGRNFDRAIRMYTRLAEDPSFAEYAQAYRDTVLFYMDARTAALDGAGLEYNPYKATIDKANYMYNIVYDQQGGLTGVGSADQVFELYQEADTAYPDSVPDFVINFLGQQYLERDMKPRLIEWGPTALERIDTQEGKDYFEANILDEMFGTSEERFAYFYEEVQNGERDPEIVGEVFDLAFRLGRDDAIAELKPIVLGMEPSPRVIRILIQATDDLDEKLALYDQAIELTEEQDDRISLMYQKAVLLQSEGQIGGARQIANQILEMDEDHGPSIIIIGDYWAGLIGSGDIASRSPVWVAVDYYNRAASRDESVASAARQKASSYSRFYPCQEDGFFQGLRSGQGYTTPQGARTTVRLRNC
ncbi:MAG: hypothetical protein AAF809_08285 [Bacteroidota bacterium]